MDETIGQPTGESQKLDRERAQQLETARRLLFENNFVPDNYEDVVNPRTGHLRQRDRAMMAFNNLMIFLPGTWGDGSPKPQESVPDQQFIKDFLAVADEAGIDMRHIDELNHGEVHGTYQRDNDSVFALYQYAYPAMEKLIKEKGYRVIW